MATKRCCCVVPPLCVPCEEFDPCEWSIYESIIGFTFSGEFSALNESLCKKVGCDCKRADAIEAGAYSVSSPWSAWIELYTCGACRDCTDPEFPEALPPCVVNLTTGETTCPGGYPTYKQVQWQSRSAANAKYWYSKGAIVCVEAIYVSDTQIKFVATVTYAINTTSTGAYAVKRRYRSRTIECTSNKVMSTGGPSSSDDITAPEPFPPCEDLLGEDFAVAPCEPYEPPYVPDPCETEVVTTISDDPCEKLVSDRCVNVPISIDLVTEEEERCCGGGFGCVGSGAAGGVFTFESEIFNCDEVPDEIELLGEGEEPTELVVSWTCDPEIEPPDDIVFIVPNTLTLTLAQCA